MLEDRPALAACSWLAVLLAFACLHAAAPKRRPRLLAHVALPADALRLSSVCLFAISFACLRRLENAVAAAVIVLWASALAGSLFVLLVPLYPRAVWALVGASAPLLFACACWELLS